MKHNVKQLKVWQRSIKMTVEVYKATDQFPKSEVYGLRQQIRKCAVSVPSNIAEGAGRNTNKDFCNFLGISNGSSYELITQLIVSKELGYISEEKTEAMLKELDEVQKMTYALQSKLSTS
jgi:four helix bundle protein